MKATTTYRIRFFILLNYNANNIEKRITMLKNEKTKIICSIKKLF